MPETDKKREQKDYQTSELRLASAYMNTGELSSKVDQVLDHRYRAPIAKKPSLFTRFKQLFNPDKA